MSGLEIVGGIAAGLQIIQQVWNLGALIFDKPKDTKALAEIRTATQNYSAQLLLWETNLKDEALHACQQFRTTLDDVVQQIDALKTRKKRAKVFTALKLYKPDFQEKFTDALTQFTVRMCVQSQRSVDEMDGELKGMTNMMEELKISAKKLDGMPGMECAFVAIQEKMERLTKDMENIGTTAQQTQRAMHELQNTVTAIVPQFERAITSDGELTRATVAESTRSLFEHINKSLDLNDSLTRIKAELVPNPQSLVWNDSGAENGPTLRVWSLDNSPDDTNGSRPNAEYEGRELLSVRLNETVETVYTKKHIADDLDDLIRERKRRRVDDVSPYFGLAKRGEFFEELREYMPPVIRERYKDIPHDIRRQALQIARRIGQEHYYVVLDRILQQKADSLPKLSAIENMERAMLATYAEKLNVSLGFFQRLTIDDANYLSKLRVNISSVGYKISSEEYPSRYILNDIERSKYNKERATADQKVIQKLHSTGWRGLGEILRMSLAIFTHPHRPQETQILLGDQGIEDMFRSVFSAGKRRGAHDLYERIYSRVPVLYHSYECRDIGDLIWNQCVISTPTSKMEYSGPHLFRDYVVSAAFGRFESGDIKGARDLFAKAVLNDWRIRQKSDQSWYALLKICEVERDYGAALEVAEMIVASCQNRRSSWIAMLCVYKKMNDVEVAIKRFKQAIDGQHFACLQALSMAYEHIGDNLNAIATLEKGIEVDPIEGYFYRKEIARIYEHRIQDYEKAVQTLQAQLTVSNTDLSRRQQYDVWCSLGFIYKKMEKFGDVIMAYEKSIDLVYNYYLLDTIVDAYIKNNDMDGAVERIKSEIIKSPEDNALQKTLGDLYMTIGNHDAAVDVFAAAIARNLGSSELEIFWNSPRDAKRSKEILEAQFTPMRWRYWRGDKKY